MHCAGSENDVDANIWNRCSRFADVLVRDKRAVAVCRVLAAIALCSCPLKGRQDVVSTGAGRATTLRTTQKRCSTARDKARCGSVCKFRAPARAITLR